jgi:hypothetical protein
MQRGGLLCQQPAANKKATRVGGLFFERSPADRGSFANRHVSITLFLLPHCAGQATIVIDLVLNLAHPPFGDLTGSACADEGVEAPAKTRQKYPQATRRSWEGGEVFEHKGGHRSLSLLLRRSCLR